MFFRRIRDESGGRETLQGLDNQGRDDAREFSSRGLWPATQRSNSAPRVSGRTQLVRVAHLETIGENHPPLRRLRDSRIAPPPEPACL